MCKSMLERLPRTTVMMGVPTFYTRLLGEPAFDRQHCRSMRLFVAGSAPLLAETHQQFEQRTGHRILERYGMSETLMLVSNPYFEADGERLAGTVGVPLPASACESSTMRRGAVHAWARSAQFRCDGPNVFSGYWRMPEKTREEFTADGWFQDRRRRPLWRSRRAASIPNLGRTLEGPDHLRRLQRLSEGDRGLHR